MFKLTPFNTSNKGKDQMVDFYNVIDDFFHTSPFRSLRHDTFKLDVEEQDNKYVVVADLPGINKEDLKVSYDDQTLTIKVVKTEEKETNDEQKNYLHKERHQVSMKRSLYLPNLEAGKIKAKLENGVLTLHAEKVEVQDRSHVIEVE